METLYQSASYLVVRFDPSEGWPGDGAHRGSGFEIVDRLARRETYLRGALAERFEQGVRDLVRQGPSEESLDDFIAGFVAEATQPLVLH